MSGFDVPRSSIGLSILSAAQVADPKPWHLALSNASRWRHKPNLGGSGPQWENHQGPNGMDQMDQMVKSCQIYQLFGKALENWKCRGDFHFVRVFKDNDSLPHKQPSHRKISRSAADVEAAFRVATWRQRQLSRIELDNALAWNVKGIACSSS